MSAPALRVSLRNAALVGVGAGVAFTSYNYYNTHASRWNRSVHAESLPSDSRASLTKVFPGKGFTELTLESSEMVNHNVKKLRFALPEDSISGLEPITSLLSQHTPEGKWIPVFRPYTPVSDPDEPGHVTFMIKRYDGGAGSTKMHSMIPGDKMKFKPLEELKYKPNEYSSILMIAGGSGITPIYQLTRAILKNPEDKTKIALIYANNSSQDILLRAEFEELQQKYPGRFQKIFTVSKQDSEDEGRIEKGYVTKEMIAKIWPSKDAKQKVLVSGPPAMIESIAGAKGGFGWTQGSIGGVLQELGYTKEDVHKF